MKDLETTITRCCSCCKRELPLDAFTSTSNNNVRIAIVKPVEKQGVRKVIVRMNIHEM